MKPCILRNDDNTIKQVSAPNGKPSKAYEALNNKFGDEQTALRAYANMYTPEFQSWFKDSKVVDENGEPKIVYVDIKNENPSVFVLGENLIANVPMVISSTNPNINEDGNYVVEDIDEVQDVFGGYKDSYYEQEEDLSPMQQAPAEITTLALSETEILRQQKQALYYNLRERLKKVNDRINKIEKQFSSQQLSSNKKELEQIKKRYTKLLNFKLKSEELVESYRNDLKEIEKNKDEKVIKDLVNKDFDRLNNLVNKNGLSYSEYAEAKTLVNFFSSLQPVKNKLHPFFTEEQLFDEDGNNILEQGLFEYFNELSEKAVEFNNKLIAQRNKLAVKIVNSNVKVKNLYGEEGLEYKEILKTEEGLKDVSWFDKMLMDATMGVFSDNGIIPQVALSEIILLHEQRQAESEKRNNKIDKLQPLVEAELRKLGQAVTFLKIPGVSYEMFKQKDQFGLETGNIITRYSTKFYEEETNVNDVFNVQTSMARFELDPNTRTKKYNAAANKRQSWYRKNTIQVDVRKLPEIIKDKEFEQFSEFFDEAGSQQHQDELKQNMSSKAYNEMVLDQKRKLLGYLRKRNTLKESQSVKAFIDWDRKNNPFIANEYFYDNKVINHETDSPTMEYNVHVPRKNKAEITLGKNDTLNFLSTNESTNFYDENFNAIENNKALYDFHTEILKVLAQIRSNFPPHLQDKIDLNTVMSVDKTLTEALLESSSKFDAFTKLGNRIANSFRNAISGKLVEDLDSKIDNNKINESFIQDNINEISRLETIGTLSLEQALDIKITKFTKIQPNNAAVKKARNTIQKKIDNINKNLQNPNISPSVRKTLQVNLKKLNEDLKKIMTYDDLGKNQYAVRVLSELLGVDESIEEIKKKLNNDTVLLQPLIKKISANEIARQKSFDLPRIMKYYSSLAAKYQAKNDSKPLQDILKEAYENIKTEKGAKKAKSLSENSAKENLESLRVRASEQYDSWYNRAILDRQGKPMTEKQKELELNEKSKIKRFFKILVGIGNGKVKKLLDAEEKAIAKKIDKIIELDEAKKATGEKGLSKEDIDQLKKEKETLGRDLSIASLFDGILLLSRLKSLGFSLSSAVTNRMEGIISNNIVSALGYISYDNHLRAVNIARKSFWKNLNVRKNSPEAVKVTTIMNKLQKIQDSANELQKSSVKSSYTKLNTYLNPYELNKRVEFLNQSTLIVGSLLDTKIKDKDGNESNVFDALNPDGTLQPHFKTGPDGKKNIENWELFKGDDYKNWTLTTESLINLAHGNYSELRGMLAKDSTIGRTAMMFKSWLPMAVASRFAVEQENIILNKKAFKGRYLSYTKPAMHINSALLGFVVTGAVTGGIGVSLGAALTAPLLAHVPVSWLRNRQNKKEGVLKDVTNNIATDMGYLREAVFVSKILLLKAAGMPINRMAGKALISEKTMGTYLEKALKTENFTEEDARNMDANMTEAAMLTQRLIILSLMSAIIMADWETEDEELRPGLYNYTVNQLQNLNTNNLSMIPTFESVGEHTNLTALPAVSTTLELGKTAYYGLNAGLGVAASKLFSEPEFKYGLFEYNQIQAGKNAGKYHFWNSAQKLIPGTIRDITQIATGDEPTKFRETFVGNPFDAFFERQMFNDNKKIKALRLRVREKLKDQGLPKSEIDRLMRSNFKQKEDIYKKLKALKKEEMGR
jgi:hypothetical protein